MTPKNLKATKKNWEALYAKANAQETARRNAPDYDFVADYGHLGPVDIMTFALDNANDTFNYNEDHPDYWAVAFGSIQCSAEANCVLDQVAPWFKANRWTF